MEYENDIRIHRMTPVGNYKFVRLKPNEEPMGNKNAMIDACISDPWLISDVHISSNERRTYEILTTINSVIKPIDRIIFLGDLDDDKGTGSLYLTKKFIENINTKHKFLILGNHDKHLLSDYIDMGFVYVTDTYSCEVYNKKILLSHCPEPIGKDRINIHGHLHGSGMYWNMNPERHYDAFVGTDDCPEPVRMKALLNIGDE